MIRIVTCRYYKGFLCSIPVLFILFSVAYGLSKVIILQHNVRIRNSADKKTLILSEFQGMMALFVLFSAIVPTHGARSCILWLQRIYEKMTQIFKFLLGGILRHSMVYKTHPQYTFDMDAKKHVKFFNLDIEVNVEYNGLP